MGQQSFPGSSEQLQQATVGKLLSSSGSCFLLRVSHLVYDRPVFPSSVSMFLSVTLRVFVSATADGSSHRPVFSLSALCKGKVIHSLMFPVLKRTPGLRVKSRLSYQGNATR